MRAALVVGDLRVQMVVRRDGRRSFTIVDAAGVTVEAAEGFLRLFEGSGTQRTYAYFLVDHLRWLVREGLAAESVRLEDLIRYMGAAGAKLPVPGERPWRVAPRRPYGARALQVAAACVKGFYLHRCALGVNIALRAGLDARRLPARADRDRRMLGHLTRSVPVNPLAVFRPAAAHPKMLPDQARPLLLAAVTTARDRLVVTWLADGGLRIGELTGLHLADLHLRADAACGQCGPARARVPPAGEP